MHGNVLQYFVLFRSLSKLLSAAGGYILCNQLNINVMKKIILAVAVVAAAMTAACAGESAKVQDNEKALKAKIENCTNSDSLAVYVDQARAYAQQLVNEGKVDEAKKYLDELTPAIEKQDPSLKEQWTAAVATIDKVSTNTADSVGSAVSNTADSLKSKAEDLKDAAAEKAGELKDAAADKAGELKDAASEKLNAAKEGTKNAVNNAVESTQNALENLKK